MQHPERSPWLVSLARAEKLKLSRVGGRVKGLSALKRLGLFLPSGYVVTTGAFAQAMAASISVSESSLPDLLRRSWVGETSRRIARLQSRIFIHGRPLARSIVESFPPDLKNARGVAFLSSPSLDDTGVARDAGLLKTYFWGASTGAPVVPDLELGLLEVWALAADEQALTALRRHRVRDLTMGVLLMPLNGAEFTTVLEGSFKSDELPRHRSENGALFYPVSGKLELFRAPDLREPTELQKGQSQSIDASALEWLKPQEGGAELAFEVSCFGNDPAVHPVVGCELVENSSRLPSGEALVWSVQGVGDFRGTLTPLTHSLLRQWTQVAFDWPVSWLSRGSRRLEPFEVKNGQLLTRWDTLIRGTDGPLERGIVDALGLPEAAAGPRTGRGESTTTRLAQKAALFQRRLYWLHVAMQELERDLQGYYAMFRELDLGILPTDGPGTTLRETRHYLLHAQRLWFFCKLTVLVGASTLAEWLSGHWPSSDLGRVLVAALVPDAALPLTQARRERQRLSAEDFCARWGYLPWTSTEISAPRVEEVLGVGSQAKSPSTRPPPPRVEHTGELSGMRLERDRLLAEVELVLGRGHRWLLSRSVHALRDAVSLLCRAQDWVHKTSWMMRRTVLDVDRRLCGLDERLQPGSAFYCTPRELERALWELRTDLFETVEMRRRRFTRDARELPPLARDAPPAERGLGNGRGGASGKPVPVDASLPLAVGGGGLGVATGFLPWLSLLLPERSGWLVTERAALSAHWLSALQSDTALVSLPGAGAELLRAPKLEINAETGWVRAASSVDG